MRVFEALGTNEMMDTVYPEVRHIAHTANSRNGPVLTIGPATFVYYNMDYMINLCPIRDANPFFHLMEAMAMIAGLNSVEFLSRYTSNIAQFSDDGLRFNAFYGSRMADQVDTVVDLLKCDPNTRQAVIQLWDKNDLWVETKDKACNMSLVFRVTPRGSIDMTIFCRSNDMIWGGVSGANMAHFPIIFEYIADRVGRSTGKLIHVVNDAHIYLDNHKWPELEKCNSTGRKNYLKPHVNRFELTRTLHRIMREDEYSPMTSDSYINGVVIPMNEVYVAHRDNRNGLDFIDCIECDVWRLAAEQWLRKRESN